MPRILLVEDSPTQARTIAAMLQAAGFDVAAIHDAEHAFERVLADRFDLVLADLLLPKSSGLDLCRRLKTQLKDRRIPVVLITRLTDPHLALRALVAGADGFTNKNRSPGEIVECIRRCLLVAGAEAGGISAPKPAAAIFPDHQPEFLEVRDRVLEVWRPAFEDILSLNHQYQEVLVDLRHSERRYRSLVTATGDIIWTTNANGEVVGDSPAWRAFTGQTQGAIQGPGWLAAIHPDERAEAVRLWFHATTTRCVYETEYRLRKHDGTYRQFLVRAVPVIQYTDELMSNGGLSRDSMESSGAGVGAEANIREWVGTCTDITERRQAEAAARAAETELRVAREIQQKLFPPAAPQLPGFDIAGASYPAQATGGDYFDYIPMRDGYVGIVIGDVSGHGLGPAMLMAATRAYLRALALTHTDVTEILTLANRALAADVAEGRFMTLGFARLDPRSRSLVHSSAGHPTGFVLSPSGTVKTLLSSTDLPLGLVQDGTFSTAPEIQLESGEMVLLLTDGITETTSPEGTSFGDKRALETIRANRGQSAADIVEALRDATRQFAQNQPQLDDITAVVIKLDTSREKCTL